MSDATNAEPWQRLADEIEIRNLLNRLANLADSDDLDAYVACFTEDASWELPGAPLRGHAEIRAGAFERRKAGTQGVGSDRRHVVTNQVVNVDGSDVATSESYMLFLRDTETTPSVEIFARYEDTLWRTADGWKLARRIITLG